MVMRVAVLLVLLVWLLALWVRWRTMRRPAHRRGEAAHLNADGSAKRNYRSRSSASRAAREYERDFGERMHAYRCRRGCHWHIGHAR